MRFTIAFFLCITAALSFTVAVHAEEKRPNILFIIADDASRESFGVYGSTYVKTPAYDRLANEGVRFTNAYNCNPKCAPARACLLTGRYSWQLEEAANHQPFLRKWQFYPFLLQDAGYEIGLTGKGWGPGIWLDADPKNLNPAGPSFDKIKLKPPYKAIRNVDYGGNFKAFLDQRDKAKPFCFWLGTSEPHRAYEKDSWKKAGKDLSKVTVPAYYPDNQVIRGDLADYALEVEWFDKHIGDAIKHLEDKGLLDNTVILATSDHGMPFPRVKGQIYDDGFHIPFVVRWGDKIKSGRTVTDYITFPDVAPTLLEIAGVKKHEQMTGQSFLPQLLSEKSGRIDEARSYTLLGKERHDIGRTDGDQLSVTYPVRAIRNDDYLLVVNFKPHRWPVGDPEYNYRNTDGSPTKSYLTRLAQDPAHKDYKFYEMAFGKRPEIELYDMREDTDCVNNLAKNPEYAVVIQKLRQQLTEDLKDQGDPRILGKGEIFEDYPNRSISKQQKLYKRKDWDPLKLFNEKYPDRKINP